MDAAYSVRVFEYGATPHGQVHATPFPAQVRILVPVLLEGSAPRGVFFPAICLPCRSAGSVQIDDVLGTATADILGGFYTPSRWAPSLHAYLVAHALASAWDARSLPPAFALLVEAFREQVRTGSSQQQVWDLSSGRPVSISELLPRTQVYRSQVANVGDLSLDTRFIVEFDSTKQRAGTAYPALLHNLALVNEHRLYVSSLRMEQAGAVLEFESTIGEWLAIAGEGGEWMVTNREIARVLAASLELSDPLDAVIARVAELRSQFGAADDEQESASVS